MKILIIEDEPAVILDLKKCFGKMHWKVFPASTYKEAIILLSQEKFDVIICDHHFPYEKENHQGLNLVHEIRKRKINTPVLILTGCDADKITPWEALDIGVDDFVKKPYHPAEIIARIKALSRRAFPCDNNSTNIISHKGLSVDLDKKEVTINKKKIHLSGTLFLLLIKFLKNIDRFLSYENLIKEIWGESALYEKETNNTLRVHISYLRNTLGKKYGAHIKTIHGRGFIYEDKG